MVKDEKTDHHCLKADSDAPRCARKEEKMCAQRGECRAQASKFVNFIGVSDWNTCITLCALFHIRHRIIMAPRSPCARCNVALYITIDSDSQ